MKKIEKKYDLGRYERVEKTEVVERKKFKPSPIISPVYGILNEDYKPEDIKEKKVDNKDKTIDFNSVRKKAFGEIPKEEPISYYEETVTVKLKENEEEKKQKVKTIDELLDYVQHDLSISGSSEGQQYLEYSLQWHSLFLLHQLVMRPVTEFDE